MNTFGASAPLKHLVEKFGFTPDAVTRVARDVLA
jgi:transketolase